MPLLTVYTFATSPEESTLQAVTRLCDEAGWAVEFEDDAAERLRDMRAPLARQPRHEMAREEFVAMLCERVGLCFEPPNEKARVF